MDQTGSSKQNVAGALYLVATPIGNLEDITLRAVRILREADIVACEDTRHTRKLLDHYGIQTHTVSYHEHNEVQRATELIERVLAGARVALVSDAGTPLVSDPGYRLVAEAIAAGISVIPIPGPSAVLGALAASGLSTDEFRFCGFLSAKTTQRHKELERLKHETCTLVFYEAPHRILDTLAEVSEVFGARLIVVARELTKLHEEILRGTAEEVRSQLASRPRVLGEITLLISKADAETVGDTPVELAVQELEAEGVPRMEAIKQVAKARNIAKREVYRRVTESRS